MYGYIYKVTNKTNGKIYVGKKKSNTFDDNYYGSGSKIRHDVLRYGKKNFDVEILRTCNTEDELIRSEIFLIDKYDTRNEKIGYNISKGGEGIKMQKLNVNSVEDIYEDNEDIKIVGYVYETENYNLFNFMDNNREVNEKQVANMTQEFEEKQQEVPVVTSKDFTISDGQHRHRALEALEKPVRFIVSPTKPEEIMLSVNNTQKSWKYFDYMTMHAKNGNKDYSFLLEAYEYLGETKYKINITALVKVLTGSFSLDSVTAIGSLEIRDKSRIYLGDKNILQDMIENYMALVDSLEVERALTRTIVIPLFALMSYDNFDVDTMLQRFRNEQNRNTIRGLRTETNLNKVFSALLNMYNKGIQKDKNKLSKNAKLIQGDMGEDITEINPVYSEMNDKVLHPELKKNLYYN